MNYVNDLGNQGFDLTNGFNCNDAEKFGKVNNLSINTFELNFCLQNKKWKHKLKPFEITEKESDGVVDLLKYKNHYVLLRRIHVFLCNQSCNFLCRRCLSSYTSQNVLTKHKQQCEEQEITSIRTS